MDEASTRLIVSSEVAIREGKAAEGIETLQSLLSHDNPAVRREAYRTLCFAHDSTERWIVLDLIENVKTDADATVRAEYPVFLVMAAVPNAYERVQALLNSPDLRTRQKAAEALEWVRLRGGVGVG